VVSVIVPIVIAWLLFAWQPSSANEPATLADRFRELSASTRWRLIEEIKVGFETHHPQGMAVVGDRIYVSSVEVIDRAQEQGRGYVFEMDHGGNLLRTLDVSGGKRYHPGGIDFDGEWLWVPVAEYKPDSSSVILAIDIETMTAHEVLRFDDHLGGVVHDRDRGVLVANSWGSRRFYRWETTTTNGRPAVADAVSEPIPNPSHYVDFQDGQWVRGTPYMIATGLKRYRVPGREGFTFALGGAELFDLRDLRPAHQVAVPLWEHPELPLTQNPVYFENRSEGLRAYFMPADNTSTLHVYEVR
jgi:hypothetical protein